MGKKNNIIFDLVMVTMLTLVVGSVIIILDEKNDQEYTAVPRCKLKISKNSSEMRSVLVESDDIYCGYGYNGGCYSNHEDDLTNCVTMISSYLGK